MKSVANAIGAPAFPVTPTFPLLGPAGLLPLPTRYRIYFGDPIHFQGHGDEEDEYIEKYVTTVREKIEEMIAQGLRERQGIFS